MPDEIYSGPDRRKRIKVRVINGMWSSIAKMAAVILSIASIVFAAGSVWKEVQQHTIDIAALKAGQDEMNRKLDRLIDRLIPSP